MIKKECPEQREQRSSGVVVCIKGSELQGTCFGPTKHLFVISTWLQRTETSTSMMRMDLSRSNANRSPNQDIFSLSIDASGVQLYLILIRVECDPETRNGDKKFQSTRFVDFLRTD